MEALSTSAGPVSGISSLPLANSGRTTLYVQLIVTAALLFVAAVYVRRERLYPALPVVFSEEGEDNFKKTKQEWPTRAREIINRGLNQIRKPFQVISSTGPKIVLPNTYANEIKSDPRLSFAEWSAHEFLAHLKGFEPFGDNLKTPVFVETVRTKLTQALGTVTEDLCAESEATLLEKLGENKEWTDLTLKSFVLQYVARLSTRIFLGPELCRNQEWLDIIINFTIESFQAVYQLRKYPAILRPLANLFLPGPRRMRAITARARAILGPEIERRRKRDAELVAKGEKVKGKDTVTWMDQVAKGKPYDPVTNQLFFSVVALHTTSDLITHAMFDLITHSEVIDELRDEVRRVIKEDGWKKTSLYKLKLMDSVLKESQRLHPFALLVLNRKALEPITLKDGTFIPKGAIVTCSLDRMRDPAVYPNPENFEADRYLRLRERPGQENNWQFVTTSEDHLGFGHGTHACPGRFFASNEAKIALAYMLLMYDWRLPDGAQRPETVWIGSEASSSPTAKVSFRRRDEVVPK